MKGENISLKPVCECVCVSELVCLCVYAMYPWTLKYIYKENHFIEKKKVYI
jgi:hypothetical protein